MIPLSNISLISCLKIYDNKIYIMMIHWYFDNILGLGLSVFGTESSNK